MLTFTFIIPKGEMKRQGHWVWRHRLAHVEKVCESVGSFLDAPFRQLTDDELQRFGFRAISWNPCRREQVIEWVEALGFEVTGRSMTEKELAAAGAANGDG